MINHSYSMLFLPNISDDVYPTRCPWRVFESPARLSHAQTLLGKGRGSPFGSFIDLRSTARHGTARHGTTWDRREVLFDSVWSFLLLCFMKLKSEFWRTFLRSLEKGMIFGDFTHWPKPFDQQRLYWCCDQHLIWITTGYPPVICYRAIENDP